MAKKKELTAEEVAEINAKKAREAGLAHVEDESENAEIDFSQGSSLLSGSDEKMYPFFAGLSRSLIGLKNRICKIPLFFGIVSLGIICCCEFVHIRAIPLLANVTANVDGRMLSMLFFFTVLLSILSVVAYLNATGKHVTKNKKIAMSIVFYVMMFIQLALNINYLININKQVAEAELPTITMSNDYISHSYTYTILHTVFLCITIVFAALEPLLQPLFKKIPVERGIRKIDGFFKKLFRKDKSSTVVVEINEENKVVEEDIEETPEEKEAEEVSVDEVVDAINNEDTSN